MTLASNKTQHLTWKVQDRMQWRWNPSSVKKQRSCFAKCVSFYGDIEEEEEGWGRGGGVNVCRGVQLDSYLCHIPNGSQMGLWTGKLVPDISLPAHSTSTLSETELCYPKGHEERLFRAYLFKSKDFE